LIGLDEDYTIEAKSAKGGFPDSFWETYSAFANSDGGVIVLGLEETKDHKLYVKDGLADAPKMMGEFWKLVGNRQKINRNILTNKMVRIENIDGKDVLVFEVPRAERTARPVYKGMDPFGGTYRRLGEGDHLCTREEVAAMMRDASQTSLDAAVVQNMDPSVFCEDTIKAYRQVFLLTNPTHLWNKLDTDMFLRRIKAVDIGDDGQFHPTQAGLLMFGYEYDITSCFPSYFLDYQEDREMVGITRWKDRIVSSSGDWSGNLFDFIYKIMRKLVSDLKIPFVLRGMTRIDDTPIHKLLREATINCLVHADYNGRQGVVITKNSEGFVFANPGGMRISRTEAVNGGVSDPRNGVLLKMFSLIHYGERAGSGLNGIMYVWEKSYHIQASIEEKSSEVFRTILTLPFGDHKLDVDALLQIYDFTQPEWKPCMAREPEVPFTVDRPKRAQTSEGSTPSDDKSTQSAQTIEQKVSESAQTSTPSDGKSTQSAQTIEQKVSENAQTSTPSDRKSTQSAQTIKQKVSESAQTSTPSEEKSTQSAQTIGQKVLESAQTSTPSDRKSTQSAQTIQQKASESTQSAQTIEQKVPESAQGLEEQIMSIVKKMPSINRHEIALKIGISDDKVKRRLAKLKKQGLIERVGPDFGGYWKVLKTNK